MPPEHLCQKCTTKPINMKPPYILFLSVLFGLTACDLEVIPDDASVLTIDFEATATSNHPNAGADVSLANCPFTCRVVLDNTSTSNDNLTFRWNFDDGATSADREPGEHSYATVGSYDITMEAFLNGVLEETVTKTVNVVDPVADPIPGFEIINDGCFAPCTVTFQNSSTNASEYLWNFGDNSAEQTTTSLADVVHTYDKPGDYTVTLTAFNGDKDASIPKTLTINIHVFEVEQNNRGAGKAIFQAPDGSYAIVGNSGLAGGTIYLLRTVSGGSQNIANVFTFPASFGNVLVSDAHFFSNQTVAVIGTARENGKNRVVYGRFGLDGTVINPPTILSEFGSAYTNRNIVIRRLLAIAGEKMAAIGYAVDEFTGATSAYLKIFDKNLNNNPAGVLLDDPAGGLVTAFDAVYNNNQLVIAASVTNGSNQVGKLFVTNDFGVPAGGFPKVIDPSFLQIVAIEAAPTGNLFCAATTAGFNYHLFRLTNNNDNTPDWQQPLAPINATEALVWDHDFGALLVVGAAGNDAAYTHILETGSTHIPVRNYGLAAFNNFNHGVPTLDGGFVFCGAAGDNATLYFVKTD
ncbi:MAG: hypothetical protein DA408_18465 [Bacteroidetes bacterium]|nr:MAG: hypothetical protein DA408_18465 [Bacteroidota bacterium]